jgi:Sulfotransferase domain
MTFTTSYSQESLVTSGQKQIRLADFIIMGAAKSGTTTLFRYLERHRQICLSKIKEPNFFGMDENYQKGLDWYSSMFSGAKPDQVCGEASTDYAKFPKFPATAKRLAQTLPDVKLIYLMRNPVNRAYAYYRHIGRKFKVRETFEEHIGHTQICLESSNYMMQIENYLQFFPKESFLFLMMEDLIDHPEKTLPKICRFIGVDDIDLVEGNPIRANEAAQFFQDTLRGRITAPLRSIPFLEKIAKSVPQSWRDMVYKALKRSSYAQSVAQEYQAPPMLPETRQLLIEYFREPNQRLAAFLDRDLSHWEQ